MEAGTLKDFLPYIRAGLIVALYPFATAAAYFLFLFITPLDGATLLSPAFIGQIEAFMAFFAGALIARVAPQSPIKTAATVFPLIGMSLVIFYLIPESSTTIFVSTLLIAALNVALITIAAAIGASCAANGEFGLHLPVIVFAGLFLGCLFGSAALSQSDTATASFGARGLADFVLSTERERIPELLLMTAAIMFAAGWARPREAVRWPIFMAFLVAAMFYQFKAFLTYGSALSTDLPDMRMAAFQSNIIDSAAVFCLVLAAGTIAALIGRSIAKHRIWKIEEIK